MDANTEHGTRPLTSTEVCRLLRLGRRYGPSPAQISSVLELGACDIRLRQELLQGMRPGVLLVEEASR